MGKTLLETRRPTTGFVIVALIASLFAVQPGAASADPLTGLQELIAPAGATNFGRAFDIDGSRAAVSSDGAAHVYDLVDDSWNLTATIAEPEPDRPGFGIDVAIFRDRLVVSSVAQVSPAAGVDEAFGSMYVFQESAPGAWALTTQVDADSRFSLIGFSVDIEGDTIILADGGYDDCCIGTRRHRIYSFDGSTLTRTGTTNGAAVGLNTLPVALSGDRLATAHGIDENGDFDRIEVRSNDGAGWQPLWNFSTESFFDSTYWRHVDVDNGLLVLVQAAAQNQVHILREDATEYATEFTFDTAGVYDVAIVNQQIAYRNGAQIEMWSSATGSWIATDTIAAPPGAANFGSRLDSDGDRLAIGATNRVFVIDVPAEAPTCLNQPVTVDLRRGQTPTTNADVVLGTPGPDTIDALDGADTICSGSGSDIVTAGDGNDIVLAGDDPDIVLAGAGDDIVSGGAGLDLLVGNAGNDLILGAAGDDWIGGNAGDDVLLGGEGNDLIVGGADTDTCVGGPAPNRISDDCETLTWGL